MKRLLRRPPHATPSLPLLPFIPRSLDFLLLLPTPLELSSLLPSHQVLFSSPLPAFPEPADPTTTSDHTASTEPTGVRVVSLLSTAPTTNHTIGMFVGMWVGALSRRLIVAFVARVYRSAAAETEPAMRVFVMGTVSRQRKGSIDGC